MGEALGTGRARYAPGTTVTLTATSAAGAPFTDWSMGGVEASLANPLTLTLNADHAVAVTFVVTPVFADVPMLAEKSIR
jgi:hypothetical protein